MYLWGIKNETKKTIKTEPRCENSGKNKMKTSIFNNSVISQAIELGFDFEDFTEETTIEELYQHLMDFFNENSERLEQEEDECDVESHGRNQYVSYGEYNSSGDIVDFSQHWGDDPDTKVFHSDFVFLDEKTNKMKRMSLYYLVGETYLNAPDGYFYNEKTGRHEREEDTFDVCFNDSENSNNKGFEADFDYCKDYIDNYNGTDESYFEDYKGGTVSIVNNNTGETVYEEEIR